MTLYPPRSTTPIIQTNLPWLDRYLNEETYIDHDKLLQTLLDMSLAQHVVVPDFSSITNNSYASPVFNSSVSKLRSGLYDIGKKLFITSMANTKTTRRGASGGEIPYVLDAYIVLNGDDSGYTAAPSNYDYYSVNIGRFEYGMNFTLPLTKPRQNTVLYISNTSGATIDVQTVLDSYYIMEETLNVIRKHYGFD